MKWRCNLRHMRLLPMLIACILMYGNVIQAFAHPHQWVDAVFTLLIQDELLDGIQVDWYLLRNFSLDMQCRYDHDHDGVFSPEEQIELYESAFLSIALPTYYFHMRIADKQYASTVIENFSAAIIHGEVVLSFYVPCKLPVHPKLPLAITAFDGRNYTSFDVLDCRIRGSPEPKSKLEFIPDLSIPSHGSDGCAVWAQLTFTDDTTHSLSEEPGFILPTISSLVLEDEGSSIYLSTNPFTGKP